MKTITKTRLSLKDITIIGVMAAIIFIITYFVRIPVPLPGGGETMIKLANAFCLLAGILLGGTKGGFAAGIGSMLFDLTNPLYTSSMPYTFVFFFLMAYICGKISYLKGAKGEKLMQNIIACTIAAFSYVLLYLSKGVLTTTIATVGFADVFTPIGAEAFKAAVVGSAIKLVTSSINAVIAIMLANILAPILKKGFNAYGLSN